MMHAAHRVGDKACKVRCLKALENANISDQISLAALKITESDYHDAINIYKDILFRHRLENVQLNSLHPPYSTDPCNYPQ